MRSHLKLVIEGTEDERGQNLLSFIDSSMSNTEKKAFLERNHCEELALLYLSQVRITNYLAYIYHILNNGESTQQS